MRGVAERVYEEPHSGRRLRVCSAPPAWWIVRLLTDVYQDTTLEPWTKTFLERRAERAVRFGIVDVRPPSTGSTPSRKSSPPTPSC